MTLTHADVAPHRAPTGRVDSHRGRFWITGDVVDTDYGPAQRAPMYVEWEVADPQTDKPPLILVHGGGGQGTDWLMTLDGNPGWAAHFVAAGYPVYVVDRPGHGRSPYHPDVVGPMGAPFGYGPARGLFAPDELAEQQTAWVWGREPGDPAMDALVAGFGPLPDDLGYSEELDAERLARLLDRTGPAILVTHSAGGPVGWLVSDRRPDLVRAVVAVEPMGPAFAEFPGLGALQWGLTAAPLTYDPPRRSPADVRVAGADDLRVPALRGKRVVVVTGGASPFAGFADDVVGFLHRAGADAERLHLPDAGVRGNGHAMMMEANASEAVKPVIAWIDQAASR